MNKRENEWLIPDELITSIMPRHIIIIIQTDMKRKKVPCHEDLLSFRIVVVRSLKLFWNLFTFFGFYPWYKITLMFFMSQK
jgi:hypothetical protein